MTDQSNPSNKSSKRGRTNLHAQEELIRRQLESTPSLKTSVNGNVKLPKAEAPSLDDLNVFVEALPDISKEELVSRFQEELRQISPGAQRDIGEAVQAGDDVLIDIMGYCDGQLIPFSIQSGITVQTQDIPLLPGLGEALPGVEVGKGKTIHIELTSDYPIERLQGKTASFVVDVRAARAIEELNPEEEDTLEKLGLGKNLEDVFAQLAADIEAERGDELLLLAQSNLTTVLCERSEVVVPEDAIDEEIHLQWLENEAPVLTAKNFTKEEQTEALNCWKNDASTREGARKKIKTALILKALIEEHDIKPDDEIMSASIDLVASTLSLSKSELQKNLDGNKQALQALTNTSFHLAAMDFLVSKAHFTFEDDDGDDTNSIDDSTTP